MKCADVNALLEGLHDGGLDLETVTSVESHMSLCPSCTASLEELRILGGFVKKMRVPTPSAGLDARVLDAIRRTYEPSRERRPWGFRVFTGSLRIPIPAIAMTIITVAIALVAAIKVGMLMASPAVLQASVPGVSTPAQSASGPTTGEIRNVVAPVVQKRVRTIYVSTGGPVAKQPLDKVASAAPRNLGPIMSGSVAENRYFTRLNLSGFQPPSEMRPRIIEVKQDEK